MQVGARQASDRMGELSWGSGAVLRPLKLVYASRSMRQCPGNAVSDLGNQALALAMLTGGLARERCPPDLSHKAIGSLA